MNLSKTRSYCLVLMLCAPVAGCAAIFGSSPSPQYRVRAIPGPAAFEAIYPFQCGDLAIRASAKDKSGAPAIRLELRNVGAGKLTIKADRLQLRASDTGEKRAVVMFDEKGTEQTVIELMSHEFRAIEIRAADGAANLFAPCVLEVRGVRDERADGGCDFDLLCEEVPDEDPNSMPPKFADTDDREVRRPLRDTSNEPLGAPQKKKQ